MCSVIATRDELFKCNLYLWLFGTAEELESDVFLSQSRDENGHPRAHSSN